MAFTDNCDLYVAFHEDGVNQVIRHIMRQRPSLFNYGTDIIANKTKECCEKVEFTPDVQKHKNPIFFLVDPIPVLGADSPPVSLNFCAQLTKAKIDFHPGDVISLPEELRPPLEKQHFALEFRICGSISCPSSQEIDGIQPTEHKNIHQEKPIPPVVLNGKLRCFCLDVFVVGHFELTNIQGKKVILGKADDIDIVDITPEEFEDNLICYLKTTVNVLLREKFFIPLEKLFLSFPLFNLAKINLFPTPIPPVPNNPAMEDDQLKAFITMEVIP